MKHLRYMGLLISLGFFPSIWAANALNWNILSPGLEYVIVYPDTTNVSKQLYAFQIDPEQYEFNLLLARNHHSTSVYAYSIANQGDVKLAINGGFFTPNFTPLGLRIDDGKLLNPLKKISWWGIFMIKDDKPSIVSYKNYRYSKDIDFAVQAGPRLVINGKIPSLKNQEKNKRSALCITRQGKVIMVITNRASLSLNEFAHVLKRPQKQGGLGCQNALNLDGGSSSQLYANVGNLNLQVSGFKPVSDIIYVTEQP